MAEGTRMQQRRATAAVWTTSNYVLAAGELGVTTDTGIIKIGNGVTAWVDLDPAFDSQYLPILGKAADSELLDGIGADSFVKDIDTATAATGDKVALRFSDGRLKAATGVSTDDVVNYAQMTAADTATQTSAVTSARLSAITRTVTGAITLQATDIGGMIVANNSSYTHFNCTIPTNATVAIPVGSSFRIVASNKGPVKLVPAGGVTLRGYAMVYGSYSYAEVLKIATDEWLVVDWAHISPPIFKSYPALPFSVPSLSFTAIPLGGADPAPAASASVDSLGSGEQWSGSFTTRVFCRREGYYDVHGSINMSTPTRSAAVIYVNGVNNFVGAVNSGSVAEQTLITDGFLKLQLGDYIEMVGYQESGSGKSVGLSPYSSTFFQWRWHSPL